MEDLASSLHAVLASLDNVEDHSNTAHRSHRRNQGHAVWADEHSRHNRPSAAHSGLEEDGQEAPELTGHKGNGSPFSWGRWGSLPTPLPGPGSLGWPTAELPALGDSSSSSGRGGGGGSGHRSGVDDPYSPLPDVADFRARLSEDLTRCLHQAGFKNHSADSPRSLSLLHPTQVGEGGGGDAEAPNTCKETARAPSTGG